MLHRIVHPTHSRVISDDNLLELRADRPIEIAQHKDYAPHLNARYLPVELSRGESAACKTNRSNRAVILKLREAADDSTRYYEAVTLKPEFPIKERM